MGLADEMLREHCQSFKTGRKKKRSIEERGLLSLGKFRLFSTGRLSTDGSEAPESVYAAAGAGSSSSSIPSGLRLFIPCLPKLPLSTPNCILFWKGEMQRTISMLEVFNLGGGLF